MPSPRSKEDASPDPLRFEEALERLEAIVAELESGDLALERALAAFEEGVALSRRCQGQLEEAERRIERLVGGAGGTERVPFQPADEGEPGD